VSSSSRELPGSSVRRVSRRSTRAPSAESSAPSVLTSV
jgi:hypothetical protein